MNTNSSLNLNLISGFNPGSNLSLIRNKKSDYPDYSIPSGCAVFGVINESGRTFSGSTVLEGIAIMHDRSNGLGGGFAAYGIYPEYVEDWAFHVLYDDSIVRKQVEQILKSSFKVLYNEAIPTRKVFSISKPPMLYRYFLKFKENQKITSQVKSDPKTIEENFIVDFVMKINSQVEGAYIISSGKNMGIFKGVGFPEDIGDLYKIDGYKGYLWTAHGRFPTNSIGWWGGAHPFGLLNWSVVHNGEISSYGRNQRFVGDFGYKCTLSTDTEVIAYMFDLLFRRNRIDIKLLNTILAAPFWKQIERMPEERKQVARALRIMYGGALINGPFSIIVGYKSFMYALNDRIKLRPLVAAKKGDYLFVSSEESAIKKVCINPDYTWHPEGGEPVIGFVKGIYA
jgi:glutamate synthase domain-containing protein 1